MMTVIRQVTSIIFLGCFLWQAIGCALGGGGTFNQTWKTEDKCKALGKWANQYHEKFPKSVPTTGKVAILYQDESFIPVFGTPFDQMSIEQLRQQKASVLKCFEFPGYSGALYANQHYRFLVGPLLGPQSGRSLDFTAAREDIVPIVIRVRANKKWMEAAIAEAKAQPATEAGYAKMLQLLSRSKEISADLSPQEGVLFDIALSDEMRRIAPTILIPRIDAAIAKASTYEGLKQLKPAMDDNLRLFNLVPREIRVKEEGRVKHAIDEGVKKLLEVEWTRFESRGTGLAALKNGIAWYRDFDSRYRKVFDVGEYGEDLFVEFHGQRRKDLKAAGIAFLDLAKSALSLSALESLEKEYLFDFDYEFAKKGAGQETDWLFTFKGLMQFQQEKWKFSSGELALMTTPGQVTVPQSYGPPSAEEIQLAFLRAFESNGGRILDRQRVTVKTGRLPDVLGVNMPDLSATIGTLRLGGPTIKGCAREAGAGYLCEYSLAFTADGVRAFDGDTAGGIFVDQFVLTSSGWQSESAERRISEAAVNATVNILGGIQRALPTPGCMGRDAFRKPLCRR